MLVQILALVAGAIQIGILLTSLRRISHFVPWVGLLVPLLFISTTLSNMGPGISWETLSSIEIFFFTLTTVSMFVSLFLLWKNATLHWLFWTVWLINSLIVIMMIYLAFFFKLF